MLSVGRDDVEAGVYATAEKNISSDWNVRVHDVKWYPSDHSCVRRNMNIVRPQQMPPLMVRKAAWRR